MPAGAFNSLKVIYILYIDRASSNLMVCILNFRSMLIVANICCRIKNNRKKSTLPNACEQEQSDIRINRNQDKTYDTKRFHRKKNRIEGEAERQSEKNISVMVAM